MDRPNNIPEEELDEQLAESGVADEASNLMHQGSGALNQVANFGKGAIEGFKNNINSPQNDLAKGVGKLNDNPELNPLENKPEEQNLTKDDLKNQNSLDDNNSKMPGQSKNTDSNNESNTNNNDSDISRSMPGAKKETEKKEDSNMPGAKKDDNKTTSEKAGEKKDNNSLLGSDKDKKPQDRKKAFDPSKKSPIDEEEKGLGSMLKKGRDGLKNLVTGGKDKKPQEAIGNAVISGPMIFLQKYKYIIMVAAPLLIFIIGGFIIMAILGVTGTAVFTSVLCEDETNSNFQMSDTGSFLCSMQDPLKGSSYDITSHAGYNVDEEHAKRWHDGIDLAPSAGSHPTIYAVQSGEVIDANDGCPVGFLGNECGDGFGNYVTIKHGEITTTYGHMLTNSVKVKVGDSVDKGQAIGQVGSTGSSTGDHLHFEVRKAASSEVITDVNAYFDDNSSFMKNCKTIGSGSFTKYNLSNTQLLNIANLAYSEQGSAKGAAAEASLMANLFEIKKGGGNADAFYSYISDPNGWFGGNVAYLNNRNAPNSVIDAVKSVLIDGKRTLPGYIDEHDCLSCNSYNICSSGKYGDICSLKNSNNTYTSSTYIKDKSNYKKNETVIKNVYGSTYTFYSFPTSNSDPFGYTSETIRKQKGEAYYDFDTGNLVNGSEFSTSSSSGSTSRNLGPSIIVGDSRVQGMALAGVVNDSNSVYKGAEGYGWFIGDPMFKNSVNTNSASGGISGVNKLLSSGTTHSIISWLGVNDALNSGSAKKYYDKYAELAKGQWSSHHIFVVNVGPVQKDQSNSNGTYRNSDINTFNSEMENYINSSGINNLHFIKLDYSSLGLKYSDNVHYTSDTYKTLYNEILKQVKTPVKLKPTIILGDSRTRGIRNAGSVNDQNSVYASGEGYSWLIGKKEKPNKNTNSAEGGIIGVNKRIKDGESYNIIAWLGANDIYKEDLYYQKYAELAKGEWKNHDIYVFNVGPYIGPYKHLDNHVDNFNAKMKKYIQESGISNLHYMELDYDALGIEHDNSEFEHYTYASYRKIYKAMIDLITPEQTLEYSSNNKCCVGPNNNTTTYSSGDANYCPNGITVTGRGAGTYSLDDYIDKVVSCENPVKAEEALKAQAIAARTFALNLTNNCTKSIQNSTNNQVMEANHCPVVNERIKKAIEPVRGSVMLYNGKIFSAQYLSFNGTCNGSTCTSTIHKAPDYSSTATFTMPQDYLSLNCDWDECHSNGMSQNGANYMAEQEGKTYDEILRFFYADGIEITGAPSTDNTCSGGGGSKGFHGDIIGYYQQDFKGNTLCRGSGGDMGEQGCVLASAATVVSTLTGQHITPVDIRDNIPCYCGYGCDSNSVMPAVASKYGLSMKTYNRSDADEVLALLNRGDTIFVVIMNPGLTPFANQYQHDIVIYGGDGEGNTAVWDPYKAHTKDANVNNKMWDFKKSFINNGAAVKFYAFQLGGGNN